MLAACPPSGPGPPISITNRNHASFTVPGPHPGGISTTVAPSRSRSRITEAWTVSALPVRKRGPESGSSSVITYRCDATDPISAVPRLIASMEQASTPLRRASTPRMKVRWSAGDPLRTGFQTVMSPPGTRSARIAAAPGPRVALIWITQSRTEGATPPRIAAIQIRFRSTTAPRWAIGTPRPPLRPGREPSTPQARVLTRRSDAPSSRAARPSSGGRSDVSATGSWVATALSSFRVTPRTSDTSGNHSGNTPRPSPPGPPAVEAPRRRPALGPERP